MRGERASPNSWPVCLGTFVSLCVHKNLPPHYVYVYTNVYTTSIYSSSLPISLCRCGHVWIIFVQATCKSKVFLQPNLEEHLHNILPCHCMFTPRPPNLKTEVDVRPMYSLFFIHCKAYQRKEEPSPAHFMI